ncbi:hypothetical protein LOD99_1206 [Oopsacas minuta]|uniref:Chloride channel protein n=1 Tax=Oopsacas minuta TaxID=111878 RepID=A0AAV7K6W8_9METZ|nr:hypothetical protein LOD99_1206 [Oopsacas minuta]
MSVGYTYEESLTHGVFKGQLSDFSVKLATTRRDSDPDFNKKPRYFSGKKWRRVLHFPKLFLNIMRYRIGYDWVILIILGVLMALLSATVDYIIDSLHTARLRVYDYANSVHVVLSFFVWVTSSLVLLLFAVGFTKLISTNAIGSGIPEMKSILRGVRLIDYLSLPTFVAKIGGLLATSGSGLPIGKEGPFVHLSSIIAHWLSYFLTSFRSIYSNEVFSNELLAAACAVGVACNFAAPIGGVLFSIEVTATYFAVRQYWRGFFGAVCGSFVFSLIGILINSQATITALFFTHFRPDYAFDTVELIVFSLLGLAAGFLGAFFVWLHKSIIKLLRKYKKWLKWLQIHVYLYPAIVMVLFAIITFPPGLGMFCGGRLPMRTALDQLFSNYSWVAAKSERDRTDELEEILDVWQNPNVFVTLVLFLITRVIFAAISIGLPVPAGVFLPVFVIGAAFGRLVGELMVVAFPAGFNNNTIVPGAYAVIGAAAVTGAVTHTISTSVIVFELTGQITHVLPVLIAVLLANAVAQRLQPSFYDSIILLKKLPYLPELPLDLPDTTIVKQFMRTNVPSISTRSTYRELKYLISSSNLPSYPVIDNSNSRFLIGSVKRSLLEDIYARHIVEFKDIYAPMINNESSSEEIGMSPLNEPDDVMDAQQLEQSLEAKDSMIIKLDETMIDAAPFQLVEKTSLIKVHTLFALLSLNHSYVTQGGRLVGIVTLKEIRAAIEEDTSKRLGTRRANSSDRLKNIVAVFNKKGHTLGDENIIIEENSED